MPYKRGTTWMAQIRVQGSLKRRTFQTKSEAITWEVEQRKIEAPKEEKFNLQRQRKKEIVMICLIDLIDDYLDFSKVKHTIKAYEEKKSVFKRFLKFADVPADIPVDCIEPDAVLGYLDFQATNRSGHAANKDRKHLVAAWNWGFRYKKLPAFNPFLVDRFPEVRQIRYMPPESDFWKVYDTANNEQDKVMLLSYIHLAARRSELFKLKWDDIDFVNKSVRLYTRKRKEGSVESDCLRLSDELYTTLLSFKQKKVGELVFSDPRNANVYLKRQHWMKTLCKKAGVKRFGLYAIRHLTASTLARTNQLRNCISEG
jgi:integrase